MPSSYAPRRGRLLDADDPANSGGFSYCPEACAGHRDGQRSLLSSVRRALKLRFGDRTQLAEQVGACSPVASNRRTRNCARSPLRSSVRRRLERESTRAEQWPRRRFARRSRGPRRSRARSRHSSQAAAGVSWSLASTRRARLPLPRERRRLVRPLDVTVEDRPQRKRFPAGSRLSLSRLDRLLGARLRANANASTSESPPTAEGRHRTADACSTRSMS